MATDRTGYLGIPAAAALLLWPALWNGYPIVFADTGTYLSQAVHRYAGWDRPVFYSLFMLPLHATATAWPVVVVQALLAAWVLRVVCRVLLPRLPTWLFVTIAAGLAVFTWLPWVVSELMPDLFTPLVVLILPLLACTPTRLKTWERLLLAGLATLMIAAQQSSLPLAVALLVALRIFFGWTQAGLQQRGKPSTGHADRRWRLAILPPGLAVLALCATNLAAHGSFAVSPFGNVFLLARVIYDGPGKTVLQRDCPTAQWRLCPYRDRLPPNSDDFLWDPTSPLNLAGGPKLVSLDAGAIIQAALLAEPATEALAAMSNTLEQLRRFRSGDGLQPWPAQVTPWIQRDFPPAESARYAAARQQNGRLDVPWPLAAIHQSISLLGVAICLLLLPRAIRRRADCAGFLLVALVALPVSAAITGGLSAPHERYQSRIMWLPPFIAALSLAALRQQDA